MFKKILIGLLVILAIFLVVVALQPSHYRVERSVTIAAPAAEIFPQVNDLHKSAVWSPWLKMDPNVKTAYEGAAAGVGASSTWAGNDQIGEGRQTITESKPNELVRIRLDFKKPMEGTAMSDFVLKPATGGTTVTWAIYGENNFVGKAFCLFMSQDKMIGEPFERGLANLKAIVETKQ